MRTPLAYGPGTAGDYVRLDVFKAICGDAKHCTLLELAERNRSVVSTDVPDLKKVFAKEWKWFQNFHRYHPDHGPSADYLFDKYAALVTNWSSFSFKNIAFNVAVPIDLLTLVIATENALFSIVSFRGSGVNRKVVAAVHSQFPKLIDCLHTLAQESDLFTCS
jgi:hypothetical protein